MFYSKVCYKNYGNDHSHHSRGTPVVYPKQQVTPFIIYQNTGMYHKHFTRMIVRAEMYRRIESNVLCRVSIYTAVAESDRLYLYSVLRCVQFIANSLDSSRTIWLLPRNVYSDRLNLVTILFVVRYPIVLGGIDQHNCSVQKQQWMKGNNTVVFIDVETSSEPLVWAVNRYWRGGWFHPLKEVARSFDSGKVKVCIVR